MANPNESPIVYLSVKGVTVQKQLIKWSEIQSTEQTTDDGDGILLLIPGIGSKLGNCFTIITKDETVFIIYKALIGYDECIDKINEQFNRYRI